MENKDPSVLQSDWIIQKYANLKSWKRSSILIPSKFALPNLVAKGK